MKQATFYTINLSGKFAIVPENCNKIEHIIVYDSEGLMLKLKVDDLQEIESYAHESVGILDEFKPGVLILRQELTLETDDLYFDKDGGIIESKEELLETILNENEYLRKQVKQLEDKLANIEKQKRKKA
jgi:hypothetical protein